VMLQEGTDFLLISCCSPELFAIELAMTGTFLTRPAGKVHFLPLKMETEKASEVQL
jgi:hypothetical protein